VSLVDIPCLKTSDSGQLLFGTEHSNPCQFQCKEKQS
jgi:hypothetical protein